MAISYQTLIWLHWLWNTGLRCALQTVILRGFADCIGLIPSRPEVVWLVCVSESTGLERGSRKRLLQYGRRPLRQQGLNLRSHWRSRDVRPCEAKFMLPWSFSEEAAAGKYMAQIQHNMWVMHSREAVLSIITGGGKWIEVTVPLDPLYLTVLVSAEKKFWRCVQSGEVPHLINAKPPRPRIEAIRIVDMTSSNSWAEFAALFCSTRSAFLDHERGLPFYSRPSDWNYSVRAKSGRNRRAPKALRERATIPSSAEETGCNRPDDACPAHVRPIVHHLNAFDLAASRQTHSPRWDIAERPTQTRNGRCRPMSIGLKLGVPINKLVLQFLTPAER
jgi:hypothetical protein